MENLAKTSFRHNLGSVAQMLHTSMPPESGSRCWNGELISYQLCFRCLHLTTSGKTVLLEISQQLAQTRPRLKMTFKAGWTLVRSPCRRQSWPAFWRWSRPLPALHSAEALRDAIDRFHVPMHVPFAVHKIQSIGHLGKPITQCGGRYGRRMARL